MSANLLPNIDLRPTKNEIVYDISINCGIWEQIFRHPTNLHKSQCVLYLVCEKRRAKLQKLMNQPHTLIILFAN